MWASIDSISFTYSIVFPVSAVQSRDSPALPLYSISSSSSSVLSAFIEGSFIIRGVIISYIYSFVFNLSDSSSYINYSSSYFTSY